MKRKMQLPREIRILAGLYSFSGLYVSLLVGWMLWWMATTPGGWLFFVGPLTWVPWICFAFFCAAFGVLRGRGWARWLGFFLSAVTIIVMLFVVLFGIPDVLEFWLSGYKLSFLYIWSLFSPLLLVTNVPCVYYLTRSSVRQYLHKERGRSACMLPRFDCGLELAHG